MTLEEMWAQLAEFVDAQIERKVAPLRYFADYGEVVAVNGAVADVKINGSADVTKGVPIRSDLALAVGNKVVILRLNYNGNERLIIDKLS